MSHGEEAAPIYLGRTSRQASPRTAAEARRPDTAGVQRAYRARQAAAGKVVRVVDAIGTAAKLGGQTATAVGGDTSFAG